MAVGECPAAGSNAAMEDKMRVKDVMTRKVAGISPQATIAEAVDLMVRMNVSGLPVIDATGTLVGMLSEGDLLRRPELGTQKAPANWLQSLFRPGHLAEVYTRTHGRKVEEIMTSDVITVDEGLRLEEAAALMEKHHVKRLPVIRDGQMTGIIARSDFVRALANFVRPSYEEAPVSDAKIKASIKAELKAETWAPVGMIDVEVKNAVVSLNGVISDESQRNAIRVIAENTEGVREVHDHLAWVTPYVGLVTLSPEDEAKGQAG